MRVTDLFRRLVSHFSSSDPTPPETREAKQPAVAASTTTSSGTTLPKTTRKMPGLTSNSSSKYSQIPGPLGLASASLEGKVALVTGAALIARGWWTPPPCPPLCTAYTHHQTRLSPTSLPRPVPRLITCLPNDGFLRRSSVMSLSLASFLIRNIHVMPWIPN
ncbi:hypothetical protein B0H63DRAFT_191220 [Podospora didyma]|uniref:Uncharacterized protein n=1 Tax=Podospora didyma TaxID=330526 RepID=A0AAE0NR92_9PEZI|nr:hypothetical protein B0H63DRAFT_191220 [Podospora didyma]